MNLRRCPNSKFLPALSFSQGVLLETTKPLNISPTILSTTATSLLVLLIASTSIPTTTGLHLQGANAGSKVQTQVTVNSTLDYLTQALNGLDLALSFFQREKDQVNLDAVIGTRIVQASLSVLLNRLARNDFLDEIPRNVISNIRRLQDVAGEVSNKATPYIIANEPDYFNSIGSILTEGLFNLNYDSRDAPSNVPEWTYNPKEMMKEEESDACLAEVFGTRTGRPCDISTKCWNQLTQLGYNRYSLSHEIFYLEIAEMSGCHREMGIHMKREQQSLRTLHDTFCTNMLVEANLIADNGFPPRTQDLFMEQGALCGMLGYRQFFNSDWLIKILSWQDPVDGCYRWAGWPLMKSEDNILALKSQSHNQRHKREEKRVSRDCLCHRTAVAASALSQYVRYILEVWIHEQVQ